MWERPSEGRAVNVAVEKSKTSEFETFAKENGISIKTTVENLNE